MLLILDEMNNLSILKNDMVSTSDPSEIDENRYGLLIIAFERQPEQQNNNKTEPGERQITETFVTYYRNYIYDIQDRPADRIDLKMYNPLYQNLRVSVTDIYDVNINTLEQKNSEIQASATRILNL